LEALVDFLFVTHVQHRPIVAQFLSKLHHKAAFLELKALWNATERCCAWYMMGADGLKEKINRSKECNKVGYTEMLSRYGDRYSKVTPDDGKEREQFLNNQARIVAKVNAPAGADIAQIVRKTCGGLRRVYTEIEKLKMTAE
jgi:alkylated DNA repair dioxygenase AlkB